MRYTITRDYIRTGNARSGQKLSKVRFIVSHDTGNPGSTAYNNRNYFDRQQPSASAHTFIDDKYILEIIPLNEKAWHVRYDRALDNLLFGDDSNDAAIGIELCHGGSIDFDEAYKRYVWYHAYLCDRFNLNPTEHIVAHSRLDPERRSDPQNALSPRGITWSRFISDVVNSLSNDFNGTNTAEPVPTSEKKPAKKAMPMQDPTPQVKGVTVSLPVKKGDSGQFVKEIQQDLIKAGISLPRYGADGEFGDETESAVRQFQKQYGLIVDGLVGPQTLSKLDEVIKSKKTTTSFNLPSGILRRGDRGENVRKVQRALRQLNFIPGSIDGIYGPKTEDAVRRFQSTFAALSNDGIYGPNTKRYMERQLSK